MKKITIAQATEFTSPNPLTLICTNKPDGLTNLAPVSFVSYLAFEPPMIGFAMGKTAYTGDCIRQTGQAVITVPGKDTAEHVIPCGASTGRNTDKVKTLNIHLEELPDCAIKIPAGSKLAFVVKLNQTVEVGDHYLYICDIEDIYGNENTEALFAWNGYAKVAPAQEK